MRSRIVDGNDVGAVYEAASEALRLAREGEGPTFLEAKTYRHRGHSRSDPAKYRPEDEVRAWLDRDPLKLVRRELIEAGHDEAEIDRIDAEVAAQMEEAVERAKAAPWPELSEVTANVYA
jgi:pyruvate dehydrogenase E1 component alpha subunit